MPILLGNIFQQMYNTADALIVGRFLDKAALAAVTSSGSLIFMMVGFFNGIAMGAGVVIAKYFGAKDERGVSLAVHTDVAFGLVAGVILTVLGVAFTPTILQWMKTPDNVLPNSIMYFRIYFCGAIFVVMYNIFVGILQAVGDSKHPLYYLICSSILNVVLDLLFVGGFHWGVWSAALATTISQGVSVVLCLHRLMKYKTPYQLRPRLIRFHLPTLKNVIRFGLPSGVQNSIIAFANLVVQSNINSFGDAAMAGCGIYKPYTRPEEIKTDGLYGQGVETVDTMTLGNISWQEMFTDPYLQQLIQQGLDNNTDLQSAYWRVKEAEATLKSARLAYLPSFNFAPNGGVSSLTNPWNATWTYTVPATASWEVDIFGKLTNSKRRAKALLAQSQEYQQAVRTQVIASVSIIFNSKRRRYGSIQDIQF